MGPRPRSKKPDHKTFGHRLKAARLAAGMSPLAAADAADVGLSTYYSWEADAKRPRDLAAAAAAVKTTVGALYGER